MISFETIVQNYVPECFSPIQKTLQATVTGLVRLCVDQIYSLLDKKEEEGEEETEFTISVSIFEIVSEKMRDLMVDNPQGEPQMREDKYLGVTIANLTLESISHKDILLSHYHDALARRSTRATKLNDSSSRSHCCVQIHIEKANSVKPAAQPKKGSAMTFHCKPAKAQVGVLTLVDLAGCEDNRRTDNKGFEIMAESSAINNSHFVLGKVLFALKRNMSRVAYRDSKLTRLLKNSLDRGVYSTIFYSSSLVSSFFDSLRCGVAPLGRTKIA